MAVRDTFHPWETVYTLYHSLAGRYRNMLSQLQNSPSTPILLNRVISAIMTLLPAPRQPSNIDKTIHVPAYRTSPGDLVDLAIESSILRIVKRSAVGGDDPFFVADLGQIVRQHRRWIQNMPGIRPFYGMHHPI